MSRPKGSKNKKTTDDGAPADPSGLRAAGKKLAADDAAKAQSKLVLDARDIAITREEIELPHKLAETEVTHITAQAMALEVEITALSKDLNDLQTQARGKSKEIEKKRKETSKLAAEAHTKTRMILVGVKVEHDYPAAQLRYYRLDRGPIDPVTKERVGELYDTKAMPPEEREKAIFTAPKDAERVVVDEEPAADEPPDAAAPGESVDEPDVDEEGGP